MRDPAVAHILHFWFGTPGDPEFGTARDRWFRKSEAFDAEVRAGFASLYAEVTRGAGGVIPHGPAGLAARFASWLEDPRGTLALVVLLDQFPRNMFRDTPRAFEADPLAAACTDEALARGHDLAVSPLERVFFYLPLEHSEDLERQRRCLELFAPLAAHAELASFVDYARRHHDVIARFGRFPHRNRVLGRADSESESEFLRQPGSRF